MKHKINSNFRTVLFITLLISGVFLCLKTAKATGDAYFPQDTTISFDLGNFTITAGSDADEVSTSNSSITVKISAGQSFTFKSPGRKILTNNGGYSYTCTSSESSIKLTVPAGDPQKTVKISPDANNCDTSGAGGGGGGGGGGGSGGSGIILSGPATPTPTPIPLATPLVKGVTEVAISLSSYKLKEGDVVSAAGSDDPDVYIVNEHGYKRLFLNPVIFSFYGHLGGFSKVKSIASTTREALLTSGLFRNCETSDKKVYGVEVNAEDAGVLHWVNTTGEQAVIDDPNFFKKVFCINNNEFNWYPKGLAYTSVNQIPNYSRKSISTTIPSAISNVTNKYEVGGAPLLNVRKLPNISSALLGKLEEGKVIESLERQGMWHKIKYQSQDGWVHGDYLEAI